MPVKCQRGNFEILIYSCSFQSYTLEGRAQWPRALLCWCAAAWWMGLWFRIPPGPWMSFSCRRCVLSGREVSASGWSLAQRSPTECDFEFHRERECLSLKGAVCCQVERSLRRADHLSRGVLPNVICPVSVIAKTRKGRPWPGIESKRLRGDNVVPLHVPCGITKSLVSKYEQLTKQ
jgi:hypothetical protein